MITYECEDDYGIVSIETYQIESACNSVGLFMNFHKWAILFIEKNHKILSVALVE